ncbi:choice-of-anchor K domain-containing protein [Verrucomicrobia bacterium]|nr:choice-of-anchor K domain-containing protein [Verrucomicrobiota bacterium]
MVALDLPDLAQETFEFPLNIITTTNNSNREESADIVEIGVPFSERRIVIDGVEFGLRLMFGNTTEEGFSEVDRFFVFEDGTATADLRGVITRFLPQAEPEIELEIATAIQVKFRTFPGS